MATSTVSSGLTRYAPYVEEKHSALLNTAQHYRIALQDDSPYIGYVDIPVDGAFFGAGYSINSFPSLYDMFGKYIAGLDIEKIWSDIFERTLNSTVIDDLVTAESALLDDEIDIQSIPKMGIAMRDANAVLTSTFVINKALIESQRVKTIVQFSGNLKYNLIPEIQELWKNQLNWNKTIIDSYANIIKLYYSIKLDITNFNYGMRTKDILWPFTVLDYEASILSALQGAAGSSSSSKTKGGGEPSQLAKSVSGAVGGAAAGAMIGAQIGSVGGPWGAVIGGALGLAASFF